MVHSNILGPDENKSICTEFTSLGHIYLYCKGYYKTNLSVTTDLIRIFSDIYVIDSEYVTDSDIVEQMLKLAMKHLEGNPDAIMKLILNLDPNSWHYTVIGKFESYSDAVIKQCISIIARTTKYEVKLPKPDYARFFTTNEMCEFTVKN